MVLNSLPKSFKFIANGYSAYLLAAQQFFVQSKGKINFDITQVIGLTNDDANYDLAIWVTYYNFLRPHEQAGYKVLNKVGKLEGASSKPDKWQLLIFL